MSMLNSQPLQGYKHGDFVKFKYNTIVYHQEKGLPMFRDVTQYGWLATSTVMNGKVSVQPIGTEAHKNTLRVEANNIISKASWNGNLEAYPKSAPEGFQVDKPVFPADPSIPRYAGGDIPIRDSKPGSFERVIPYDASFDKKTKDKPTGLEAEIAKQKEMINGKVRG